MVSRAFRPVRAEAEAAAWVARLQSDDRSSRTDAALQDWLRADPAHAAAFERATELWAILPGAVLCSGAGAATRRNLRPRRRAWSVQPLQALAASVLLLLTIGAGWWALTRPDGYATGLGEQKVATLEDGSRIALNTDSEVEVRYGADERRVELERGEAMFEVAPNHVRPFIVTAGDKQVRALGTSFIVRRTPGGVVVTLIEGKVSVTDIRAAKAAHATVLVPGERLTANGDAPSTIDQPAIDAVTAWRRGQAVFADTPLSAAVAELNRYGGPHIAVDDPHIASLRVSGIFATNDTSEFAAAIAALHGLRVERTGNSLRIVR